MLADFADDLVGKIGAAVEHGHDDAEEFEARVDAGVAQLGEDAGKHRDAFERVILALERDQQPVHGRKAIQGEHAEGGRAVEDDEVELVAGANGLKGGTQAEQVVVATGKLDFHAAEIDFAGDDVEAVKGGGLDLFEQRAFAEQGAVGAGAGGFVQADAAGGVGLRIDVHEEDALAEGGETGGEVDGRGGFAHPALLIGDSHDVARHGGQCKVSGLSGARLSDCTAVNCS